MVLCKLKPRRNTNALSVRNAIDPFARMGLRMNSLLDDFFSDFGSQLSEYSPRTDVVENDDHFQVSCELPGMDEKDISVSLTDDTLTIEGEKKYEHEEKEKGYHHIERSYGTFKRVIPFASPIDSEKVKAEFKKGVLKVTLPRIAEDKPEIKKIPVNSN